MTQKFEHYQRKCVTLENVISTDKTVSLLIFIFVLVKSLFFLLGWFTRDGADVIYRKRLDSLWDRLHEVRYFVLVSSLINILRVRFETLLRSKYSPVAIALYICFCYFLNLFSVIFSLFIADATSTVWERALDIFLILITKPQVFVWYFVPVSMLVCFDILSLAVAWFLINRSARAANLFSLLGHLFVDVVLVVAAVIFVAYVAGYMYDHGYFTGVDQNQGGQRIFLFAFARLLFAYADPGGEEQYVYTLMEFDQYVAIGVFIVSATMAIPTLLYVMIIFFALLIRMIPRFFKPYIIKAIYCVSTDDKPVLSQLGTLVGVICVLLIALNRIIDG